MRFWFADILFSPPIPLKKKTIIFVAPTHVWLIAGLCWKRVIYNHVAEELSASSAGFINLTTIMLPHGAGPAPLDASVAVAELSVDTMQFSVTL